MKKHLFFAILIFLVLAVITAVIVAFGRGYRLNPQTNSLSSTGLLVATSTPDGAQIFIDGRLFSATNNTITLPPGIYKVKIIKDGYIPWEKTLKVQGEIVTKADASLFPVASDLRPLTTTGAINPTLSPNGTKIVYGVSSSSSLEKQGIWIIDLGNRPLSFQSSSRQIAKDTPDLKYSKSTFLWSPDDKQIIAVMDDIYYLLNTDGLNDAPVDITLTRDLQFTSWTDELTVKNEALGKTLKPKLQKFLKANTKIISYSPDETKILYEGTASAVLPQIITPPLIGVNSQPEERNVKSGKIYAFDTKEDKNFAVGTSNIKPQQTPVSDNSAQIAAPEQSYPSLIAYHSSPFIQWLWDSDHLISIEKNTINVMEYDGTNKATIYSASFENSFVFPFPNDPRLIILTSLNNANLTPNLYAISLR